MREGLTQHLALSHMLLFAPAEGSHHGEGGPGAGFNSCIISPPTSEENCSSSSSDQGLKQEVQSVLTDLQDGGAGTFGAFSLFAAQTAWTAWLHLLPGRER